MKRLLAPTLACLALGLVACGGDDDSSGGSAQQPADSGGSSGTVEVSMKNIQFDPKEVTVRAGETITFTNNEAIPHDVHKTSGPGDDFGSEGGSGGMQQGDTFELTLDEPGKYAYVCNVHAPGMAGTITVK